MICDGVWSRRGAPSAFGAGYTLNVVPEEAAPFVVLEFDAHFQHIVDHRDVGGWIDRIVLIEYPPDQDQVLPVIVTDKLL